ncbi:hypothetical protein BZA77DRAFT_306777 [Pyronema omphalodes]|nr:hypothetical protein BZA77DRAFT_306777 [Pyronema omphalodes]
MVMGVCVWNGSGLVYLLKLSLPVWCVCKCVNLLFCFCFCFFTYLLVFFCYDLPTYPTYLHQLPYLTTTIIDNTITILFSFCGTF